MRNRNGRQLQHYYNSYRRFPPKKLWESGSWPDFTSPRFSNRCVVDFLTSHRRLSCQTVSRNIWALCVRGSRQCSAENTEGEIKVCTWLREICSCSCLTVLPGPAWVLLSKTCKPLFAPLYCRARAHACMLVNALPPSTRCIITI